MADQYRDLILSAPDTVVQTLGTWDDALQVRVDVDGSRVWRDRTTDALYVNGIKFTGSWFAFGTYAALFDRDGTVLAQLTDAPPGTTATTVWISRYTKTGVLIESDIAAKLGVEVDPQGLHRIENGRLIMGTPAWGPQTIPNGEVGVNTVDTGDFLVYAFGNAQYPSALSYYDKRNGQTKRWLGATQLPHRAVQVSWHPHPLVAISGVADSPAVDALDWVDRFPSVPVEPPVTPPASVNDLPLPLPINAKPAAWVGCTGGPDPRPGSTEWSPSPADAALNRPVGEGAPYESTMTGRRWLDVKYSTEAAAAGTLQASIDLAKRKGVAVEIHCDDPNQQPAALEAYDIVKSAGVVPILQAHAVENVDDFEHQARSFHAKDPRFNICVNFRVFGKGPDRFRAVVQMAERLHHELQPRCVWFVGWKGAGPQMKAYYAEYCRLTPTPVLYPQQDAVIPPPQPPWTQPSEPPVVKLPPHRKSLPRWR